MSAASRQSTSGTAINGSRAFSITEPNGIGSQISQARNTTARAPSMARLRKSLCMARAHCNGNAVLDFGQVHPWQLGGECARWELAFTRSEERRVGKECRSRW